jgi:type IV pilus assembly protein PilA
MKKIQQGFTLIELMIVVAIIGILAAVAIPAYQDYIVKAKLTKVTSTLDPIKTALAMYYQEQGSFPAASESITGTGTPVTGSVWTSLGFSSNPSIPPEVSTLSYHGSTTTFGLILELANIKAGSINGQLVAVSPTSGITPISKVAMSSVAGIPDGGSALQWFYSCKKMGTTPVDNVLTRYFNNSGVSLVCA